MGFLQFRLEFKPHAISELPSFLMRGRDHRRHSFSVELIERVVAYRPEELTCNPPIDCGMDEYVSLVEVRIRDAGNDALASLQSDPTRNSEDSAGLLRDPIHNSLSDDNQRTPPRL